jgi:rare lipoprotein A
MVFSFVCGALSGGRRRVARPAAAVLAAALGGCAAVTPPLLEEPLPPPSATEPVVEQRTRTPVLSGTASWYGPWHHGRRTANGERFDQNAMTAAHPTLPLGTRVRVTNLRNGRTVTVRINDRGPYVRGRVIDLSKAAAAALGFKEQGLTPVEIERLG